MFTELVGYYSQTSQRKSFFNSIWTEDFPFATSSKHTYNMILYMSNVTEKQFSVIEFDGTCSQI